MRQNVNFASFTLQDQEAKWLTQFQVQRCHKTGVVWCVFSCNTSDICWNLQAERDPAYFKVSI